MRKVAVALVVAAAFVAGYGHGRWYFKDKSAAPGKPGERRILYYHDPMHPAYKSDKPGIAPDCGMQLVPKYAEETEAMKEMPAGTVQISPAKQQLIGVRTATVAAEEMTQTILQLTHCILDACSVCQHGEIAAIWCSHFSFSGHIDLDGICS